MPSARPLYEKRYPYLDRDMLEFLYSLPREQILRPFQRRSLMRRSLAGIVPDELLNRKRKAFVARSAFAAISADLPDLLEATQGLLSSCLGIVDSEVFGETLAKVKEGRDVPLVPILRTIRFESWVRNLQRRSLPIDVLLPEHTRLPKDTKATVGRKSAAVPEANKI
jgi:asparagine synthase (glutamine-hydrolysing)